MAGKDRIVAEPEDGFFELKPRRDAPTEPKIDAAEPHKPPKPNVKKENKKNKKRKGKLLYWYYDDKHTVGYLLAIKDSKGKIRCSEPTLSTTEDIENKIDEVKKKLRAKEKKALDLPVGTEYLRSTFSSQRKSLEMLFHSSPDTSPDISDFAEFRKLTLEDGSQTERLSVLKIICVILSSYMIRPMLDIPEILETYRLDKKELRAFHVNISKGENAFYTLKQICQSMIVCTSAKKDDRFQLTAPTIISPDAEQPILELAHLDISGCKEYHWPAPYCDTSVLLDGRNLKAKDMIEFAKINPWCSCIIYGKKQSEPNIFGYGEDIKGEVLVDILSDIDTDAIRQLVKAYAISTPNLSRDKSEELIKIWMQSGLYLERYLNAHKSVKLKDSGKFKYRIEVTALLSFLNFVQENCSLPGEDMANFRDSLLDVLLPGCLMEKPTDTASLQSRSLLEIFDWVLQKILIEENLKYIVPLPDKYSAVWPLETEHGDPIWGYIKFYEWQKNDLGKSACLVFPRKQLLQAVKCSVPNADAFIDVLASFQKEKPAYMHPTMNAKIKYNGEDKSASRTAYRLYIAELPIDENIKSRLLEMAIQ